MWILQLKWPQLNPPEGATIWILLMEWTEYETLMSYQKVWPSVTINCDGLKPHKICKFNSYLLWPSTTMNLAGLMAANNLMWVLPPPYHVQCPSLMILVFWESKLFLSKVLVFRCAKYKTWTSRGLVTMKKMASQCLGALKELASWGLDAIK